MKLMQSETAQPRRSIDLIRSISFALVATLAMQTLDILGHWIAPLIFTFDKEIAVHFPYVAVKLTVVFFSLLAFTYLMGISVRRGVLGSLTAVTLFDIYYRFAEATLDRSVFMLDEKRVVWILFHFICLVIPYYLIRVHLLEHDEEGVRPADTAKARKKYSLISMITLVLAGLFMLPSKAYLKANDLLLGLHFNDHVIIGALFLIVAVHTFYKLISLAYSTKHE